MILRRLSLSLKQQNWTAIAIEFVLLVLGVFLGIQVANWNAERETRQKSAVFTARLLADLQGEVRRRQQIVAYYRNVRTAAEAAAEALAGNRPSSNEALLVNAYRATQYLQSPSRRATFDELISTGSIGLVQDRRLVLLAISAYGNVQTDNLRLQGDESAYRALFREIIPTGVQRALARGCGDRFTPGDPARVLDYPCKPDLEAAAVDAAAAALRSDPQALRLLRRRLADVETQLSDLGRNNGNLTRGLADIGKEAP